MKKIVSIFLFLTLFIVMPIACLANNLSRIETFSPQNSSNKYLSEEKLTTDLPDDSLKVEEEIIYAFSEVDPSFPGGQEAMVRWIQSNVIYPDSALAKNEQGTVYVKFVVNKDGSIEQVSIRKGVSEAIDNEAMRVVKSMPNWTPGLEDGKPVRVYFTIPIAFRLS